MRYLIFTLMATFSLSANGGVLEIDWSKVPNVQQKTSTYPSYLKEGIKKSHLPVYLSSSLIYDKSMFIVGDKNFYAISFDLGELSVLFEGDKTYQESVKPNDSKFQKIVEKSNSVEYIKAEGMISAEFKRHGLNYAITVECADPKTDKHCTQESFIRKLYNSLVLVGGRA